MAVRVFKVNDCDWWIGDCTEQQVIDDYIKFTGVFREEANSGDPDLPRALTEADLDRLKFCDEDSDEVRTFREEMERFLATNPKLPCLFASTEM